MNRNLAGKKIMVTGGVGTVGAEIVAQAVAGSAELVRVADINESGLFFMQEKYAGKRVETFYGDVRDGDRLKSLCDGIDMIFHCAALKHVIVSEKSPFDAVQTNIIGVKNIIDAAIASNVGQFVFTSSDKAVNPTNVMGTSKLMGERLVSAADSFRGSCKTIFSSTRFGNVIGSSGSVLPLFTKQIKSGGPVTVTDKGMSRFIMTVRESVELVFDSAEVAKGGEVFVTKMPVVSIIDLAAVMIEKLAPKFGYDPSSVEIKIIGKKPGEKMYEELLSGEEEQRSIDLGSMFAVKPAFAEEDKYHYENETGIKVDRPYISKDEPAMDKKEIGDYLEENGMLDVGGIDS